MKEIRMDAGVTEIQEEMRADPEKDRPTGLLTDLMTDPKEIMIDQIVQVKSPTTDQSVQMKGRMTGILKNHPTSHVCLSI
jgi:hypothetical protein